MRIEIWLTSEPNMPLAFGNFTSKIEHPVMWDEIFVMNKTLQFCSL